MTTSFWRMSAKAVCPAAAKRSKKASREKRALLYR